MRKPLTYADTGVDVDVEELAAKIMYDAARATWAARVGKPGEVLAPLNDFSGLRAIDVGALPPGTMMGLGFDGVATKAELAERLGCYDTLGYDLIAMVCDDAVVRGAEPVVMGSILDVSSLGSGHERLEIIRDLAEGYMAAALEAGVAIINGEVAQLGSRVGGVSEMPFNWGAGVVWLGLKDRLLSGMDVRAGDALVGLRETGLRCNGLSLVRRVMALEYGHNWPGDSEEAREFAAMALLPSVIYTPTLLDMSGGCNPEREAKVRIHAVAHITGSGLPGKLGRALRPSGLSAVIDNHFDPSALMIWCQIAGKISDYEAYRTWNMGQGMVIATPDADAAIAVAEAHGVEAKVIGAVISTPPSSTASISIANRGCNSRAQPVIKFPI